LAFSLLEVVVAVGVFAIGIVAILALFAPAAKSVSANAEAEAAAAVAQALAADLQRRVVPADAEPFAAVTALLKKSTAAGGHELTADNARADYDIARDPQLLFANRDGTKIGTFADTVWVRRTPDDPDLNWEKFFEIALIRNETLSPADPAADPPVNPDANAAFIAYTVRIRWPAFVALPGRGSQQVGANPAGAVRFDHSSKLSLFVAGAVKR
jgi:type II secretory pathway pseudopilin PulG